jgi:tyrosyl-tRNA synthetase
MGKSLEGAIYLDANKTSPYEFYQYLRNIPDTDLASYMKIFTFISIDEIERLISEDINGAKKVLAYECTALVHGDDAAKEAREAAEALFGGGGPANTAIPSTEISMALLPELNITKLLTHTGLAPSNSEARRLIAQGGISLNGERITDSERPITPADFADGEAMLKKGKKVFHKVEIKET